jgi:segregation and condensation protein B
MQEEKIEAGRQGTENNDGYTGPQTDAQLMAAIEAILFTMGESVDIAAMAKALNRSNKEINRAIDSLTEKYSAEDSGIMIQRFDEAVQMSTRPDQYQNLIRIAKVPKKITLSDSVIETLSIIAYKQPITKAEVEEIRGVSSDYALNKLLDYDLVKELGRKDAPGRPILFGTTEQFLRSFGVRNLSELPALNKIKVEEFKQEAEEEVDTKLGI